MKKVMMLANLLVLSEDKKSKVKLNRNDVIEVKVHDTLEEVFVYEKDGYKYLIHETFLIKFF